LKSFDTQLHAASPAVLGPTATRVLGQAADRLQASSPVVLRQAIEQQIDAVDAQCVSARAELEALSPRAVMARGWALVRSGTDEVIRDPIRVSPGDVIHILVAGGSLLARVEAITPTGETA
jgi:exodeoxyribonuclease VII large subunit